MTALRMPTGRVEEVPPFRSKSLSEATLFRGLGAQVSYAEPVTEPCACGTPITAISERDEDITLAVRAHQRLPEHCRYRLRMGALR